MTSMRRRGTPVLALVLLALAASFAGCRGDAGSGLESVGVTASAVEAQGVPPPGPFVVEHGKFTNVYVYPDPAKETWEEHLKSLCAASPTGPACRPNLDQFSRAAIDAVIDRSMAPQFPSYYGWLRQYNSCCTVDNGVQPPLFFGSGVVTQSCIDAALKDIDNGVIDWQTARTLGNCHLDGLDPSPQINLIFSPDIKLGKVFADGQDMCGLSSGAANAYHAWGDSVPNFASIPTSLLCHPGFGSFTRAFTHEIVEMLSNPAGLGYGTFGLAEVGDICQGVGGGPNDQTTNVHWEGLPANRFRVPASDQLSRYWSNSDNNCVPRLDNISNNDDQTTWMLGEGSPLLHFTDSAHNLTLGVPASRVNTDALATQVSVVIQTGGDDLDEGSDANHGASVELDFVGGSTQTLTINNGRRWNNGQTHSAVLNLPPAGVRVSDITGVIIKTNFGASFPDMAATWNVDKVALVVNFASGSTTTTPPHSLVHPWLDKSELPLVRFKADFHDKLFDTLTVPATDVGSKVLALNLVISTGNDDLKGGSNAGDNLDVTVNLASGPPIVVNKANHGDSWPGWSIQTVPIPVPAAGLKGGDIVSVNLHTGFSGGDNWNVQRVQLMATLDPETPTIAQCQPVVVRNANAMCLAALSPSDLNNGSFSADGDVVTPVSLQPPGPFGLGDTTTTLTVTDPSGDVATCTSTVHVVDVIPPVLTPPPAFEAALCPAQSANIGVPTGTDECNVPVTFTGLVISKNGVALNPTIPVNNGQITVGPGVYVVQWTASDGPNTSAPSQQKVTVDDPLFKNVMTLPNGDMRFTVTFPVAQAYVEAFVRQNGVQNISGNIVNSQVANADGTFTYSRVVPAVSYHAGDIISARFYSYPPRSQGVFTPGPDGNIWFADFIYGAGTDCIGNCHPTFTQRADGSVKISWTFNVNQAYVEAFIRRNGVQIAAGNIVNTGVANMDGTFTYSHVLPASSFRAGDQVTYRFYSHVAAGPGVFTPGPAQNVWLPGFVYGQAVTHDCH